MSKKYKFEQTKKRHQQTTDDFVFAHYLFVRLFK